VVVHLAVTGVRFLHGCGAAGACNPSSSTPSVVKIILATTPGPSLTKEGRKVPLLVQEGLGVVRFRLNPFCFSSASSTA